MQRHYDLPLQPGLCNAHVYYTLLYNQLVWVEIRDVEVCTECWATEPDNLEYDGVQMHIYSVAENVFITKYKCKIYWIIQLY